MAVYTCGACGKRLVLEPDRRVSSHEYPPCPQYLAVIAQAKHPPQELVETLDKSGRLRPLDPDLWKKKKGDPT